MPIVQVYDDEVLTILPPEQVGSPFRLSASIYDPNGEPVFVMKDNVWEAGASAWDVELDGPRIIIRLAHRKVMLRLRQEPPFRFIVESLNMVHRGVVITAKENELLKVQLDDGRSFQSRKCSFTDCEAAFLIDQRGMTIGLNVKSAHLEDFKLET